MGQEATEFINHSRTKPASFLDSVVFLERREGIIYVIQKSRMVRLQKIYGVEGAVSVQTHASAHKIIMNKAQRYSFVKCIS